MGLFGASDEKRIQRAAEAYSKIKRYDREKGYEKAAKLGHVTAMYRLALLYKKNYDYFEVAVKWMTQAAQQGDSRARYTLGRWYMKGLHVPLDRRKALRLFEQGADALDLPEIWRNWVDREEKKYRKALENRDYGALMERDSVGPDLYEKRQACALCAGLCYEYGLGASLDLRKAAEFYDKADSALAKLRRSRLGLYGIERTVEQRMADNSTEAMYQSDSSLFEKEIRFLFAVVLEMPFAHRSGAAFSTAEKYAYGGISCLIGSYKTSGKNYEKAEELFRKGYELHDGLSAFCLGIMKCLGWSVPAPGRANYTAQAYFERAVQWGFAPGAYNLAILLSLQAEEKGDRKALELAIELAEKSAAGGVEGGKALADKLKKLGALMRD